VYPINYGRSGAILDRNHKLLSSDHLVRWPRGLRRGSENARLLGWRVRVPPGTLEPVSCECYVLSGRGLCVGQKESYRV
jgi:hypothetical protein